MSNVATKPGVSLPCWSCSAVAESPLFCPACRRIQPLAPGTDFFTMLGLPRKLRVDRADLEQRFHQQSWKLHPDKFVKATEQERELSLERSSQLNDAYRALRDPIRRVEYLLAQEGMRKEGEQKQKAPPELLEEVFELNESLDELRAARQSSAGAGGDGGEMAALRKRLEAAAQSFEEKLSAVDGELDATFGEWDALVDANADDAARKKLMTRMNEILNRRSYIRNLVQNVQKELAEA